MSWSKIKSIIIYFLIAMNIFMAVFIVWTNHRDTHIPNKVIQASIDILKQDNFECDKKLIPASTYELPILDATFYSADELSEIFFKKQLPFKTDNESLVATEGNASLTVTGNYFSYNSSKKADKTYTEFQIKKALKKVGFEMEGAVYSEKERCFYKMFKGTNLFDMYVKAELDTNGELCTISAQWPVKLLNREKEKLSFVTSVTKVKDSFPEGGKITLIEKGYSLKPLGNNNYRFVPAWRVKIGKELKIIE